MITPGQRMIGVSFKQETTVDSMPTIDFAPSITRGIFPFISL